MRLRVGIVLLLVVVALGAFNYLRPIPAVAASPLLPSTDTVPGTAPALPWPARGAAAVGVPGLGLVASSGNEQPIPAASVTKVMTALVLLNDRRLNVGDNGPILTITQADVDAYASDLRGGQSVARVEVGEQLNELQLLEGMLIPSANNFAETAARWTTGSIDQFVGKMNDLAKVFNMTHTKFADTSGASPGSVSTPSDLVRLGIQAMANPVLASIVAMPQADLPVAGTVYNVDAVLGQSGIVGIKTGSGLNTGANFLFASKQSIDNRNVLVVGCVMGQATLDAAFSASRTLVAAVAPALHVRRVIAQNQSVALYTTPWGNQAYLVSQVDVDLVEWPGMILRQRLDAAPLVVDQPLAAGTKEGTEHVALGGYDLEVPLAIADPLYPPGRFWRLTRLSF